MDLNYLAFPGSLTALIGVIAVFMKIGRKDQQFMDHTRSIKEHSKLLKECSEKKLVSADDCEKTQGNCIQQQKEANEKIILDISDLKGDVRSNRIELKKEIKSDRDSVHNELMKLTSALGRIEGAIGRLHFDNDGRIRP